MSGGIERGKTYKLDDFKLLSGMGIGALRAARRKGLRVMYAGRQGFVAGEDFLDWLEGQRKDRRQRA